MTLTIEDTRNLHFHAKVRFPDGSKNNPIVMEIGGVVMQVIFFPWENGVTSFGLFFSTQRYSRKTILIDQNGFFSEDTVGIIPDFDLTDKEPDFKGINNQEIIEMVWERIKKGS